MPTRSAIDRPKLANFAGGVAGLTSALAGLAAASFVASFSRSMTSPVVSVGDRVVDLVPSWIKDLAISLFGTNDKLALLVGIGVTLALVAFGIGVAWFAGRRRLAWTGIVLFGALGAASALGSRTGLNAISALPSLLGAAGTGLALMLLHRPFSRRPHLQSDRHPSHRRRFLAGLGATITVSGALGLGARSLNRINSAEASRATTTLASAIASPPRVPPGAEAPGAAPFFTPNEDFYRIDTALVVPQVPTDTWRMRLTGMVDEELSFSYTELTALPIVESDITLTCVSNLVGGGLVGTARWAGVRLDELLKRAGVQSGADQIVGRSVDGYTCGFPVEALADGRDALVAIAMNGEPLPLEHGFPARLIVPGIYGYASATKWLSEIEITTFDAFDHYWVPRGYAQRAPIKVQTRIDAPRSLTRHPEGEVDVAGVAWAQPIGIEAVEVRVDDGQWTRAAMADEVNGSTWRQWSSRLNLAAGRHTITVRAIDKNGAIQTEERSEPLPNGASGHHSIVVLVDAA